MANVRQHKTSNGFTFIEVLFAIIILGIGMIMIAGMLPVAIKQNSDTRNELTARAVCESGYSYLRAVIQSNPNAFPETTVFSKSATPPGVPSPYANVPANFWSIIRSGSSDVPYTEDGDVTTGPRAGKVVPLSFDVVNADRLNTTYGFRPFQSIQGDRVLSADGRFQWLAFYRRDEGATTIKLIIVAMRLQNADPTPVYSGDTMSNEGINTGNGPWLVPVEIEDGLVDPDRIKFVGTGAGTPAEADIAVADSGAFVIIAHSPPLTIDPETGDLQRPFRNNGRVFRLGRAAEVTPKSGRAMRVWDLVPGFDLGNAGNGPDLLPNTADDVPDGSMNTVDDFDTSNRNASLTTYRTTGAAPNSVKGTRAYAWIIGRGRLDPTDMTTGFSGVAQDVGVLVVDVPVR